MTRLYVCDTNSVIDYFEEVFRAGCKLSAGAKAIFSDALCRRETDIRISVPAVVFVEIFDKWCRSEEFARKFHYEVYVRLAESPNIEIRPLDREMLECMMDIEGNLASHEMHDKMILASAIVLQCILISSDTEIRAYNEVTHAIPGVIY
jgi:PIN domain nuclease of toxin-antitoxin system